MASVRRMIPIFFLFWVVTLSTLTLAASLETQISKDQISLGETVTVSYLLSGSDAKNSTPDFTALQADFQILSNNYGSSVSIVNGVMSTHRYWRLTLEPKHAGNLVIPVIRIGDVKSDAKSIQVDSTPIASETKQDQNIFIQTDVVNATPYVQSQGVYRIKLYYQTQLIDPRIEIPRVKDLTFYQLGDGKNYQTTYKGSDYHVAEFQFAFFPKQPGSITIPSTRLRAVTYANDQHQVMGSFYVDEPKMIALMSQPVKVDVKAKPANFHGDVWLPAKNISMKEAWSGSLNNWQSGTPMTRTIIIEAKGLRADQIPDLKVDQIAHVNVYTETPKRETIQRNGNIVGRLTQKVTYIPSAISNFTIPAIVLRWWNLEKRSNDVAQLTPISVSVIGVSNSNQSQAPTTNLATVNSKTKFTESEQLKLPVSVLDRSLISSLLNESRWFWLAMIFLLAWLLTLWLYFKGKSSAKLDIISKQKSQNKDIEKFSQKAFKIACHQGEPALAKQHLLSWASKQWQDASVSLEKLILLLDDNSFKVAIQDLEAAIYDKNPRQWDGDALYQAFNKFNQSSFKSKNFMSGEHDLKNQDLLPPLNPQ